MARADRTDRMNQYNINNPDKMTEEESKEVLEQRKQAEKVLGSQLTKSWKKKQAKERMIDTHMRTSFLFRKDLKARLDKLADYHGRGYRTEFLNRAIEFALDSAEAELEEE